MLSRPTSLATTTTTKEFGVLADLTTLSLSLVNCNGTSRYPPLSYSIFFILRRDFNRRVLRALTRTRKPVNLAIACVSLLFFFCYRTNYDGNHDSVAGEYNITRTLIRFFYRAC